MSEEIILEIITTTILKEDSKPNPGDINDIVNALFPSLYIILATIGAFIVTMIILTKFFYNPVSKMMKKRHDFIQKNIDDSVAAKLKSIKIKSSAKQELSKSRIIAQEIISKSKKDSEVIKQHYIDEGKKEAERLIREANNDINFRMEKMAETRNNDIIDVAMIISKKIISKNIDQETVKEYLDSYINGE
ncbi:MAG: F0F1 ATP synthase subunit B [Metamycoplasmataceae bacterium]